MIHGKKIMVGEEPINLLDGTGTSQAKIYEVRNLGHTPLYLTDADGGLDEESAYELPNNGALPQIDAGGSDGLWVRRRDNAAAEPVKVLFGYSG